VTLRFLPDETVLLIADNGVGYTAAEPAPARDDLPAGASGGMGLRGIRERLALLDGTLVIASSPGAGTTLRVTLPRVEQTEVHA
jgi:signal transduction histidine kinase